MDKYFQWAYHKPEILDLMAVVVCSSITITAEWVATKGSDATEAVVGVADVDSTDH